MHLLKKTLRPISPTIVHGSLPTAAGRPPLFMIGRPVWHAGGFGTLQSHFPDRTVVTLSPRGLGRTPEKVRSDHNAPTIRATTRVFAGTQSVPNDSDVARAPDNPVRDAPIAVTAARLPLPD